MINAIVKFSKIGVDSNYSSKKSNFKRELSGFKAILFTAGIVFSIVSTHGCQSTATEISDNTLDIQPSGKINPGRILSAESKSALQETRLIEIFFSRHNCAQVLEHGRNLAFKTVKERNAHLPLSTAVAVAICEAEAAPKDKERQKIALHLLDQMEKNPPAFSDEAELEIFKSEKLFAAGENEKGVRAKRRARDLLNQTDERRIQLEVSLYEHSEGVASLSENQRNKYRDTVVLSRKDDSLFEALRNIDELINVTNGKEAREILAGTRAQILGRIEQLFSLEYSKLENKKNNGTKEGEAREWADAMRKRFPGRTYGMRIDAIMGGNAQIPAANTGIKGAINASPSGEKPAENAPVISDVALVPPVEKIIADARAALDSGMAEKAVQLLDSIADPDRTDKSRKLKREASEVHVRELRVKVRDLYNRAATTRDKNAKIDGLKQCRQILELILSKYPEHNGRSGVERNLRTIIQDIDEAGKGK